MSGELKPVIELLVTLAAFKRRIDHEVPGYGIGADCIHDIAAELARHVAARDAEIQRLQKQVEQLRHISNVNGDWSMKHSNVCNQRDRLLAALTSLAAIAKRAADPAHERELPLTLIKLLLEQGKATAVIREVTA